MKLLLKSGIKKKASAALALRCRLIHKDDSERRRGDPLPKRTGELFLRLTGRTFTPTIPSVNQSCVALRVLQRYSLQK
ncbi:hypothetical protein E2C01_074301 [Portunus trituberculatus]|uniref:Uncharacterized protein n=1 Tax=Portunus trituberculatus TaxID=210409 RepID=A0A5B7IDY5_PORTR|nr:hypothetical protein [Portunus trituberculatus]